MPQGALSGVVADFLATRVTRARHLLAWEACSHACPSGLNLRRARLITPANSLHIRHMVSESRELASQVRTMGQDRRFPKSHSTRAVPCVPSRAVSRIGVASNHSTGCVTGFGAVGTMAFEQNLRDFAQRFSSWTFAGG